MRDGTRLDATIWRPAEPGTYPVIVERVAYELAGRCAESAAYWARRGYVFVGQNVRGCYASEGEYGWGRHDAWGANRDGYDTVEWAGVQPWSSGNVGMVDGSYSGMTQYLLAPTRPPHLKALSVREAASFAYPSLYPGGALQLVWLGFCMRHILRDLLPHEADSPERTPVRARLERAIEEQDSWMAHLPLKSCSPLEGIPQSRFYFEALDHPQDGPYWWPLSLALKYAEVDVPILHLGGWFDVFLTGTLRSFSGIRAHGRTAHCRQSQRLLVGPWKHGPENVGRCRAGEMDFPCAAFDLNAARLRWYDYWLKGIENGVMDGPAARVYLMGADRWLDLDAWPPQGIDYTPLYLREGTERMDAHTDASLNNGHLTFALPGADERPDSYAYDPHDPVPSLFAYGDYGPHDYRSLEGRMLCYTSTPLERDLAVVGRLKAVLYGLSSAPDTDWVVRLCDVHPDGRSMSICDGILRARYRESFQQPTLLVPGRIYRFEVDLLPTAYSFKAGHRLRVHVTSSDFPRYDRNLNTGGPFGEEVRGQMAVNTVFHDTIRPSHLVLPIYPTNALNQ
jgi:putative CocE/NonD family hydrolase